MKTLPGSGLNPVTSVVVSSNYQMWNHLTKQVDLEKWNVQTLVTNATKWLIYLLLCDHWLLYKYTGNVHLYKWRRSPVLSRSIRFSPLSVFHRAKAKEDEVKKSELLWRVKKKKKGFGVKHNDALS